jgi:hypothetical protein
LSLGNLLVELNAALDVEVRGRGGADCVDGAAGGDGVGGR